MKHLSNGKVAFPIRGDEPPPCPEGYIRDQKDKWQCYPDLPCIFRKVVDVETCCSTRLGFHCQELDREINWSDCIGCIKRKESND